MAQRSKGRQTRRQFLAGLGAGALAAGLAERARSSAMQMSDRCPNLLFLLTDDQRWNALGCMGNRIIRTPNLDRLAGDGVLFAQNFCTTSICMSSRASIFTGQCTRRHGIIDFATPFSESAFAQIYPALLREAGYHTGFIGKWGVGNAMPREKFDYWDGFPGQGKFMHKRDGGEAHLNRLQGESAVRFMRGAPKDRPFCLSVSFKAPHAQDELPNPYVPEPDLLDLYKDIEIPAPKTADPHYFEALPEFVRKSEGRARWEKRFSTPELYQHSVKNYYRLITGVDRAIGEMLAALRELGRAENTVIVFTSDNGYFLGDWGLEGKWIMYEPSIRTPLIVHDPRLAREGRGRRCEAMTLNIDVAPTLLALASLEPPSAMQGRSLLPLLTGEVGGWREEFFYEHNFAHAKIPRNEGVRTTRWKYIRYIDSAPLVEELYDLGNDPGEARNLVNDADSRTVLDDLRKRWQEYRESLA